MAKLQNLASNPPLFQGFPRLISTRLIIPPVLQTFPYWFLSPHWSIKAYYSRIHGMTDRESQLIYAPKLWVKAHFTGYLASRLT